MLRIDRRVFPSLPGARLAGNEGGGAEAGLADLPDHLFLPLVLVESRGWRVLPRLQGVDQSLRPRVGFLLRLASELHQQPAASFR